MIRRILNKLGIYRVYKIVLEKEQFKIPVFNKLGFANLKLAEPWMQKVLRLLGSDNSKFLDVGVNVGQTLLRWKAEYPNSKYIGVEPNTDCVYYVNKLIKENNFKNTIVLPVGFANSQSLNYLYVSKTDPSDSSATTLKDFRKDEDRKAIPIVTMPYSLLGQQDFDVIKIDVEGGELDIIKSIFDYKECGSVFICEILPVYKKENLARLDRQIEIERILSDNNYVIYRIIKGSKIGLERISEFGIHSELEACDYLFVPQSKTEKIIAKFK